MRHAVDEEEVMGSVMTWTAAGEMYDPVQEYKSHKSLVIGDLQE